MYKHITYMDMTYGCTLLSHNVVIANSTMIICDHIRCSRAKPLPFLCMQPLSYIPVATKIRHDTMLSRAVSVTNISLYIVNSESSVIQSYSYVGKKVQLA